MKNDRTVLMPAHTSVQVGEAPPSGLGEHLLLEMLEALSELGIGVAVFGAEDGICRYCSRFVSDLLSLPPKNTSDFVHAMSANARVRDRVRQMMGIGSSGGEPLSLYLDEDRLVYLNAIRIAGVDGAAIAVFVRDASSELDQRQQIARLNQLASLGQVAAGAAHEFNNNLTSVLGWAQIARQNTDAESPAAPALEIIEDNARKAKRIFGRLLDMSRSPEDGDGLCAASPVKVVEEVLTLLHFEMNHADIEVVRAFDDEVGRCAMDEDAIGQVLINIIRNAIDAIRDGGTLRVGISSDAETVRITVADDGPGMPPEVSSQVFDAFFSTKKRDDISTSGGTGLGLSISLDIVRKHGGDIEVESAPGKGTCFTISLPLADEVEEEDDARGTKPTIPPGAVVLVVDDEPDVGEMIRTSLGLQGISVLSTSNGEDAVSECERSRFDAAFVDYSMPGLSGHDLALKMLSVQPNLPIIFMSGLTVKKNSVAADFLKKPFDLDEIRATLYQVLKRRKVQESGS